MKKFLLFLLTFILIISPVQVFASEDVETGNDRGPAMYATTKTLDMTWSNTYQCMVPKMDGYTYACIVFTSYGSDSYFLCYSDGPFSLQHTKATSGYSLVCNGSKMYYIKYSASNGLGAYNYLFSESSTSASFKEVEADGLPGELTLEGNIYFDYINHDYSFYEYTTGITSIEEKIWPVAIASGDDYSAFVRFIRGVWESLYSIKISFFGVDVSAVMLLVGPFGVLIAIGILNKVFNFSLSGASAGVRESRNYVNRKAREKEKIERENRRREYYNRRRGN